MFKTLRLAVILGLGLLLPGSAGAHAVLTESQPAPQSTVDGARLDLRLHYNSRVDAKRSRLTLKGPAGGSSTTRVLEIGRGQSDADLAAGVTALPPGRYILHWDVLSVDGHVSRGDVPFSVADH